MKTIDQGNIKQTPSIKQYLAVKAQYQDCILLFRMGDFYEMFFEDAITASKILEIALTTKDGTTPMAGFPYHASESYITRLVKEGLKVAICEQLEDPSQAKGLIKRDVVRVITPGLITEIGSISPDENNFIAVIKGYSILWADITTGEIKAKTSKDDFETIETIQKISPKEILSDEKHFPEYKFSKIDFPDISEAEKKLNEYYKDDVKIEKIKSIPDEIKIILCALIKYVEQNIRDIEIKLDPPDISSDEEVVVIDTRTLKNVELFETYSGKKGSLLWAIDRTRTPMGKRKLKSLLMYPLYNIEKIQERLDAVEEIKEKKLWQDIDIEDISDLERLSIRVKRKIANPREVISIKESLKKVLELKNKLSNTESKVLKSIGESIPDISGFIEIAEKYIVENPPIRPEDGAIKPSVSEELDRIRNLKNNSEKILKEFEQKERRETGLPIKIGYNQVFGYYIEITKTHSGKVPPYYKRKQTLTQYERFTTDELEKIGTEIENALEREKKLNTLIYQEFIEKIQDYVEQILKIARLVGYLDALISLAKVADEYNWKKPTITKEKVIYIKNGRHPAIEILLQKESDEKFIPNNLELDEEKDFMWIITGPNMAGKSVFLKQNALIVILAHVGSFVPAEEAKIGLVDKIFFRTGASDDISRGRSTFYVEMEELSTILRNMTDRSFVLLDEVGRGTSTFDGICIGWATAEYINKRKVRCLFATHFHELAFLEQNLQGIKNMHFSAEKIGQNLVFIRKIKNGPAGRSWGIDVAKMAGIPDEIIKKSEKIFIALEEGKIGEVIKKITNIPLQLSIFGRTTTDPIRKELKKIDLNKITPIEALQILQELKKMAENT